MKLYHLIFILLFTLNGCNKGNSILENAKNRNKSEINIIDTTNVIGEFKQQVQIYSILFKKHSLGVENSSFFLGLLLISCIYRVIC